MEMLANAALMVIILQCINPFWNVSDQPIVSLEFTQCCVNYTSKAGENVLKIKREKLNSESGTQTIGL